MPVREVLATFLSDCLNSGTEASLRIMSGPDTSLVSFYDSLGSNAAYFGLNRLFYMEPMKPPLTFPANGVGISNIVELIGAWEADSLEFFKLREEHFHRTFSLLLKTEESMGLELI